MKKRISQIRIDGNLAFVSLYGGQEAIIDAGDINIVGGLAWHAYVRRGADGSEISMYARCSKYVGNYRSKCIHMHRLICAPNDGEFVDHIDGNGLNNTRANLRVADKSQNACNSKVRCDNTSGYKGVSKMPGRDAWRARIRINGKSKTIGYYATQVDAYHAYCSASAELHGEFGRTK